jgi:hypothetical protein
MHQTTSRTDQRRREVFMSKTSDAVLEIAVEYLGPAAITLLERRLSFISKVSALLTTDLNIVKNWQNW